MGHGGGEPGRSVGLVWRGLGWDHGAGIGVAVQGPGWFPGDRADTLLGLAGNLARSLDLSTLELAQVPEALLGYLPRHQYLLIELQTLDPFARPAGPGGGRGPRPDR